MLRFLVGRLLGPRRIGVVGTFRPISSSFTYGPVHSHSGRPSALCRSPWSHSPLPRSENKAQSSSKNVRSASLVPSRFLSTQANDEGPTDRLNEKGSYNIDLDAPALPFQFSHLRAMELLGEHYRDQFLSPDVLHDPQNMISSSPVDMTISARWIPFRIYEVDVTGTYSANVGELGHRFSMGRKGLKYKPKLKYRPVSGTFNTVHVSGMDDPGAVICAVGNGRCTKKWGKRGMGSRAEELIQRHNMNALLSSSARYSSPSSSLKSTSGVASLRTVLIEANEYRTNRESHVSVSPNEENVLQTNSPSRCSPIQYMVEDESMHSSEAQSLLSEKVKKKLKAQITEELYSKFSSADMIKLRHTEQKFENIGYVPLYMPMYVIDYRVNGRDYRALVDGLNGGVAAARVFDVKKVAGIAIGAQVASVVVSKVITTGSLGVVTVVGALTSLVGLGGLWIAAVGLGVAYASSLFNRTRPMLDRSNAFHIGFNEQIDFQRIRRQRRQERERRIHSFESLLKESKLLPDPLRLYDTLGVPPEERSIASKQDLKRFYRAEITRWHPDLHRGLEDFKFAQEKSREINRAYSILIDEESRKKYDETGKI